MLRTSAFRKVLLIGLLTILVASQAGSVSAGTNIWTSNGPVGGAIRALAIDPVTPTTLYAGTYDGVFKSTNGGSTWTAVNSGLTNIWVNALAMDPTTLSTLYAGTDSGGVLKSTDSGATWEPVNINVITAVQTLAIDPVTHGILYAGTTSDGVFKSTNGDVN